MAEPKMGWGYVNKDLLPTWPVWYMKGRHLAGGIKMVDGRYTLRAIGSAEQVGPEFETLEEAKLMGELLWG